MENNLSMVMLPYEMKMEQLDKKVHITHVRVEKRIQCLVIEFFSFSKSIAKFETLNLTINVNRSAEGLRYEFINTADNESIFLISELEMSDVLCGKYIKTIIE
jgi:hypothetical protein